MPTGPSISQSMQVPVREREVLRDYCAPPHSVSSSPSEFVSGRTDCPPTAARISSTPRIVSLLWSTVGLLRCIVHRPAKRGAFESTERDGDWPKLAGSDLRPSTTTKPNPEIGILTRMLSAMRLFAKFAYSAMALPAILILGLVLLGSTTAWAQTQSSITYSFCVWDSERVDDDRIDLEVGSNKIIRNHSLSGRLDKFCEESALEVTEATNLKLTAVSVGEDGFQNSVALEIENAQSKVLFSNQWLLYINESVSRTMWAISEDELLVSRDSDRPKFLKASISNQKYTVGETIDELTLPKAVGGAAPLTYTLSPDDLPDGLSFEASTRRLSGTPTEASSEKRYTYTVTTRTGQRATLPFTITVSAADPEFRESFDDQEYTVGETVDVTLPEARGGTEPLTYVLSPDDLPDGLSFEASTRRLSGTPAAVFSETPYTYTVTDSDDPRRSATLSFHITVSAADPEFSGQSIPNQEYTVGEAIDVTLPEVRGGTEPLTYALSPDDLPDGLSFDAGTRRLSGTPTAVFSETQYTYTVTDSDEPRRSTTLSFTITVSTADPVFSEQSIPNQEYTVGEAIDVTLPEVRGGTAPLTYALSPDDLPDGLSFDAGTRRLSGTPTAVFSETQYTYTVTDSDEPRRSATLSFTITVSASTAAEEKQTINQTVAAVAAATVSNVTSNIGARFSAPSGAPSLNFAGSSGALEIGSLSDFRSGSRADRFGVLSGDERQSQQRTVAVSELLRSGSFELVLGAAEGNQDEASDGSGRIAVWGRGDFQLFESGGGENSSYDGNLRAGYLGADITMSEGLLAGLAVSRIAAKADYTLGSGTGGGKLEAKLTNIHPYLRAAVSDRSEAWIILGVGKGELTDISRATSMRSTSDLSMRMLSAGVRHRLETDSDIDWTVLGDGSSATVETDAGVQAIDGITADVWRGRLGVEASYTTVSDNGSSLTSFVEVAGRKDGGDSVQGTGLEISPGLVFNNPESRLSVEARGRVLVLHSVDNHREYGASITARLNPRANSLGLSMAVSPTWGTPDSSRYDAAGVASLFRSNDADRRSRSLSLKTQIAYGLAARNGVLTPFTNYSLRDEDSTQLRIGLRYNLGSSVKLELSGDRQENASKRPEHSVQFVGEIRY